MWSSAPVFFIRRPPGSRPAAAARHGGRAPGRALRAPAALRIGLHVGVGNQLDDTTAQRDEGEVAQQLKRPARVPAVNALEPDAREIELADRQRLLRALDAPQRLVAVENQRQRPEGKEETRR